MENKETIDKTIINGYLQDEIEEKREAIKANIETGKEFMGYKLNKDGTIELTNEEVFKHMHIPDEAIEIFYMQYKDGYAYSKAAEKFNNVYNNVFLHQKKQIEISLKCKEENPETSYTCVDGQIYSNPNQYDINLVLLDTCLLYEKLADNKIILENKNKYKLLTAKIEPKTSFIEMTNIIELALKKYKKFDAKTQKQIMALVTQTIGEAKHL